MRNPNSPMAKLRFVLTNLLEPYPDMGEAWCWECTLNNGKTLVLSATSIMNHVGAHSDKDPKEVVNIRSLMPKERK